MVLTRRDETHDKMSNRDRGAHTYQLVQKGFSGCRTVVYNTFELRRIVRLP